MNLPRVPEAASRHPPPIRLPAWPCHFLSVLEAVKKFVPLGRNTRQRYATRQLYQCRESRCRHILSRAISPISNRSLSPRSKFRPLGKSFFPSFAPVPPSGYKPTPSPPRSLAEVATRRKRKTPSPDCRKTKGCERGREGRSTAAAPPLRSRAEKKPPSPDSGPSPQSYVTAGGEKIFQVAPGQSAIDPDENRDAETNDNEKRKKYTK
jgi:hypothetical protein